MVSGVKLKKIMINEEKRYEVAKKHAEELRGFYTHLAVYVFVIAMVVILKIGATSSIPLVLLLASSWGLGVAIHGIRTFIKDPVEGEQDH